MQDDFEAGDGGADLKFQGRRDQRALGANAHDLAVAVEFPWQGDATGKTMAVAGVSKQVLGVRRATMRRQIVGGSRSHDALDAWRSAWRLLELLVIARASVVARSEYVDEAVVSGR